MAKKITNNKVFDTDRRIRLGIWGLGRGMVFYQQCALLNIDVVAGCDYNQHMRDRFKKDVPGAFVTDDQEKFLAGDFDAVLLATYCPAHADDAIACLRAGKHVLSEVTSFHTMAEGVRLVEAVEQSGLVYNLAENYPFSAANMYLARKWSEGLFGELMYGEYEYVHEVRQLCYTYIDGVPVKPGWALHNWRSWINFHYYNTHSLGPMMVITGLRPTRVTSLNSTPKLSGYPINGSEGMGTMTPSLINMSNGSVVRNLMGASTSNTHTQRLWGTLGSSEIVDGKLRLRLGAGGDLRQMEVAQRWDDLGEIAAKTGHGGGDFWVLYYFARQILEGTPAPFDIYAACDCTSPGILAYRSSRENGKPYDVPDFHDHQQRKPYREDHYACPRIDTDKGLWPPRADKRLVGDFNTVMNDLIESALAHKAYEDWTSIADDVLDKQGVVETVQHAIELYPKLVKTVKKAQKMVKAHPRSEGARVLKEMLEIANAEVCLKRDHLEVMKNDLARIKRKKLNKP